MMSTIVVVGDNLDCGAPGNGRFHHVSYVRPVLVAADRLDVVYVGILGQDIPKTAQNGVNDVDVDSEKQRNGTKYKPHR